MKQTRIPDNFSTVCPIVHNKGLVPAKDLDGEIMELNESMNPDEGHPELCYKNWLSGTMNRKIAPSNVENDTVAYFERKYPELGHNHVLVDDMDLYEYMSTNNNLEVNGAMMEKFNENKIVEINFTDEIPANEFETFKYNLGLFILHFLYGNNFNKDYFLCFDANVPRLEKLFVSRDKVYNCITPQKIADSSSVLNNLKGKRKVYKFPGSTDEKQTNEYKYTSNFLTRNDISMTLKFKGELGDYKEKTRNDFNIEIADKTGKSMNLEFGLNQDTGPSVNYLSDVISQKTDKIVDNMKPPNAPSVSQIYRKFKNTIWYGLAKPDFTLAGNILTDLKRTGDWEQCNAVKRLGGNHILCTGDRLCALYSRIIGNHTIYGSDKRLVIAKGIDIGEYSPEKELEYLNGKIDTIINYAQSLKTWIKTKDTNIQQIFDIKKLKKLQKGFEYITPLIEFQFTNDLKQWNYILGQLEGYNKEALDDISNENDTTDEAIKKANEILQNSKIEEIKRNINTFFGFDRFDYTDETKFKDQLNKLVPDPNKIINNGELKNGSSFAGYSFEMYKNIRDLFMEISTIQTSIVVKGNRYREAHKRVLTERFQKAVTTSGNSMVDSLKQYIKQLNRGSYLYDEIQENLLFSIFRNLRSRVIGNADKKKFDLFLNELGDLTEELSVPFSVETDLFTFNKIRIKNAYDIIDINEITSVQLKKGGKKATRRKANKMKNRTIRKYKKTKFYGGEIENEISFHNTDELRTDSVLLFFEKMRLWYDKYASKRPSQEKLQEWGKTIINLNNYFDAEAEVDHKLIENFAKGAIETTSVMDRELNTIIYDFVETYEVVPDENGKYGEQDNMFLFFATTLLVAIYYTELKITEDEKDKIDFDLKDKANWLIDAPTDKLGHRNTRTFIGIVTRTEIFSKKILDIINEYDFRNTLIDTVVEKIARKCIGSNIHYVIGPITMTYISMMSKSNSDMRSNLLYQVNNKTSNRTEFNKFFSLLNAGQQPHYCLQFLIEMERYDKQHGGKRKTRKIKLKRFARKTKRR